MSEWYKDDQQKVPQSGNWVEESVRADVSCRFNSDGDSRQYDSAKERECVPALAYWLAFRLEHLFLLLIPTLLVQTSMARFGTLYSIEYFLTILKTEPRTQCVGISRFEGLEVPCRSSPVVNGPRVHVALKRRRNARCSVADFHLAEDEERKLLIDLASPPSPEIA